MVEKVRCFVMGSVLVKVDEAGCEGVCNKWVDVNDE